MNKFKPKITEAVRFSKILVTLSLNVEDIHQRYESAS